MRRGYDGELLVCCIGFHGASLESKRSVLKERTAYAELDGPATVSAHTISFHLRHIYDKLQIHSKSEAVGKAMRSWLVRQPDFVRSQSYIKLNYATYIRSDLVPGI